MGATYPPGPSGSGERAGRYDALGERMHMAENDARTGLDHPEVIQVTPQFVLPIGWVAPDRHSGSSAEWMFKGFLKTMQYRRRLNIAVIGTGISGLAAAWLLGKRHDVTIYECADRVGGHSNTVTATVGGRTIPVDTGFIVFNPSTYPNLTALFAHLQVPTERSNMSFAVSLDGGDLEYSGTGFSGLLAQPANLVRPRFWSMLTDLQRFYRQAGADVDTINDEQISLAEYLNANGYGAPFRDDHLLPMASAIWSAQPSHVLSYPAAAFIRFYHNHGLLQLSDRPAWRTVVGGSINYVMRLVRPLVGRLKLDAGVIGVRRVPDGVIVHDSRGEAIHYDHVVFATHANQALTALSDPSLSERELLGAFCYSRNLAILHSDETFMPRRRAAWSSWNYIGTRASFGEGACVTYWMNRLQNISQATPLFVTLNPPRPPRAGTLHHSEIYEHPIFDSKAIAAQRHLWSLQGERRTWFCGAYFGAGFHEDGLQAGLAVAEQLGGDRRPWTVPDESGRIFVSPRPAATDVAGLPA